MSGWSRFPLRELVVEGRPAAIAAASPRVWNLNLDQIEPNTGRVISKHVVDIESVGPSTYPFEAGTVLYSKLRPYLNKVTVADESGVATTELVPLRCRPERLLPQYLAYFLRSDEFLGFASTVAVGAKMPRMVMGKFWGYEIPVPPLPAQRRIAAILDQADALRTKRREALAQLDELQQSIFIEMFGDPGSNPMGWPERELGDLIVGKSNNGIFKKNDEYGDGMPVTWVEDLFRGNTIDVSESRRLQPTDKEIEQYGLRNGDILFCRSSLKLAGIGYNNVYLGEDKKALFECHVIRLSPNKTKVSPEFLNFALRMPNQRQKLFKFAKTVTMSTIDQDGLQRISVPIPPLEAQNLFSERLRAIDGIRFQHVAALSAQDTLFSSLQHRAFHGEL